jgi:hypothetical protein
MVQHILWNRCVTSSNNFDGCEGKKIQFFKDAKERKLFFMDAKERKH